MAHTPRKFDLKNLDGISDNQIAQHRDILYVGYVNKLNEIEERLKTVDKSKANQIWSEFRGLKADESFALNGVVLHELYFENLGEKGSNPAGELASLISQEFGSYERFEADFRACGMAARGWVVMGLCKYDGKIHNYCLDAHNAAVPFGIAPILVMDVYEHAYVIDYGVKRPPYIEAFMRNIDWNVCENRFASQKNN